jgi:uncharacterized protein
MNAFVIDAFQFCRQQEHREGEIPVAELSRLAAESVDRAGMVRWSLQGGSDSHGHPQLTLSIAGQVNVTCQRCLSPYACDVTSESVMVLARSEEEADEIDRLLEDESIDVIVGSAAFNIVELIEDEALLAIPLSPRHETCPAQLVPELPRNEGKVSPFAVLKDLKRQ